MGRLSDGDGNSGRRMQIGDRKTLVARDKDTKEVIRTYTLIRTPRPYVFDLCDAYNDGRPGPWQVDHAGNLRIGDPA